MASIKIVNGRKGFILTVDGLFINHGFNKEIKAIRYNHDYGFPYGSTEWVSIEAVKRFWDNYKKLIIASVNSPFRSDNGILVPDKGLVQ